jgi:futalosine hydrolase
VLILRNIDFPSMRILFVSATYSEIRPFCNKAVLAGKRDDHLSGFKFNNIDIDVLITGVGIASTSFQLGKLFASNKYDIAINLGIAGSFNKGLKEGEVVNVCSDIISELGAENGSSFLKFDELNLGKSSLEKSIWKVQNNYEIKNQVIQQLKRVNGITVNTVHGNKRSIEEIIKRYHPDVETMEGAAFLHICNTEKIKCAQIRSISNFVEERNLDNWKTELAIKNLNDTAMEILNTL